ncbi:MAG: cob(I)yrinic acid a,c-diamide adenosyltransferase [Anaerolineales bacterium]|nr:cob(I)yrinic acid a,c-diamide adenosyltransferase [Anaerolineales bacterium]MCX7608321.1 cob(I)yrinic acid a,c-diamide adenosyltransferase [Anaerolineales bacterium]MDW8227350.1 cob(I)yrinic acid a,c-diamide adenosyltransferase [Anaerolineales bacterium]
MTPFYTRTGDNGYTGLLGEGRFPKFHPRLEALGDLDEASAALGLARALTESESTREALAQIQRDLYALMTEVAATPEQAARFRTLDPTRLEWLEAQAQALEAEVIPPREFILPGDTVAGAAFALARTIVRRAERRVVALVQNGELTNPMLIAYLNRLSSVCFLFELSENQRAGKQTSLAKP